MSVARIKDIPYPEDLHGVPEIKEYLKRLHEALQEEQSERIEDFDMLKMDNVGWEDVRAYAHNATKQDGLANAISKIGSTETTLLISNQQDVTADATVPSTMKLKFEKGGSLNISADKTVTINQQPEAGLYQIFEGSGTVAGLNFVRPEWWYSGVGTWDDAFQSALMSNVVCDLVGGKVYELEALISDKDNITINGNGAILAFEDGITNGLILRFYTCDDVRIKDLEFDGNIAGGSVGNRGCLFIDGCNRVSIRNCSFHDTLLHDSSDKDAYAIKSVGSTELLIDGNFVNNTDVAFMIRRTVDLTISNNNVGSGGPSESVSLWGDGEETPSENVLISGNNVGKALNCNFVNNCIVSNNIANRIGIGGGSVGDYAYIANNVSIIGNTIKTRMSIGPQNGTLTDCTANDVLIAENTFLMNGSVAGIIARYKINKLRISDNYFFLTENCSSMIEIEPSEEPAVDVIISDNLFDIKDKSPNQFITVDASPLTIKDNVFIGIVTEGILITSVAGLEDIFLIDNILVDSYSRIDGGAIGKIENNITNRPSPLTIASAGALVLYHAYTFDDSLFIVSGTTNITSIVATRPSHIVTLQFEGILTFTDGGNLKLAGDFVTSADDTITVYCDGTNWHEKSRSVN